MQGLSSHVTRPTPGGVTKVTAATHSGENPYRDPRADDLRTRYQAIFGGDELPVPVEAIAEDLLGLMVSEIPLDGVSGMLVPAERAIYVNANDVPARRRFTLAHEVGHWVCQCLEGRGAPVMCRAEDVAPGADRTLEREANVFAAELLMPESKVREFVNDPGAAGLSECHPKRCSGATTASDWSMSLRDKSAVLVRHRRTGAEGVAVHIPPKRPSAPNPICTVAFDHGIEEVPKDLIEPIWEPFDLLTEERDGPLYPYDGWLRRERFRILDAYRNDAALALSNSRVEPQLHQLAVALRALEKPQPRLILADEVGLGKTIEAGLILKELRARMGSDLQRVLIVVPAGLVTQWRFELRSKFNEEFRFVDGAEVARLRAECPGENPWAIHPNVICSFHLARTEQHADDIAAAAWDLVIVDEAHHARRTLA